MGFFAKINCINLSACSRTLPKGFSPQKVRGKIGGRRENPPLGTQVRMYFTLYNSKIKKYWIAYSPVFLFISKKFFLSLLSFQFFLLYGCASSNITREASANVDLGFRSANYLYNSSYSGNIADSYQNSSQKTKGFILGGATGATVGFLTTGFGIVPGAAIGAILGSSYGKYIDSNTTLCDQLENRGVSLVVLGDQVMIVVPSARIFEPYTATIKPQAYSTLNMVACYINQFTKMLVKISVYTQCTGEVDGPLSQEQANIVSRILVAQGLDARLVYAIGCNGSHLVVNCRSGWDSDNYRIEITLEKLYV